MTFQVSGWFATVDGWVSACLTPLAAYILFSSLDDLLVDTAWLAAWLKQRLRPATRLFPPGRRQLESAPRRRIAVFVPLWKEHRVIARMLEHNLGSNQYPLVDYFVGAYPNDELTQAAVRDVAARFTNVHLALCPHDGPTSKADCLNWIYQRMLLHEEEFECRFDVVVTHDAEDLVHPEELRWINFYAARFDMIQVPVLALPTPVSAFTHGVYCDEFAEYQSRDMTLRAAFGAFVPSAGVGTAYRREALEKLAQSESNRIFDPGTLTEDYEIGLRLHRLGCSQVFIPILRGEGPAGGAFVATREYFPQSWGAAVRQRTRWTIGNALQAWQRHGWRGSPGVVYWLWRDRKGLFGNPAGVLANLMFAYGAVTWCVSHLAGMPWGLAGALALPWRLLVATAVTLVLRIWVRSVCVARIYGWTFAMGVPLRAVFANFLNAHATLQALCRFTWARLRHRSLVWVKTEHSYPSRAALLGKKPKLGEILVDSAYLVAANLEAALRTLPAGLRLGEYLVHRGLLTEDEIYEALSLQQGLPAGRIEPREVASGVARALPAHIVRDWKVLPFKIVSGNLYLASPEIPTEGMTDALHPFTSLELRFQLVPPSNFEELTKCLIGRTSRTEF